jgi:hypothetical protein
MTRVYVYPYAYVHMEGPKMYTHLSEDISFNCPAIEYGDSGIHVTSTIFWENTTLHIVYYVSVKFWKYA